MRDAVHLCLFLVLFVTWNNFGIFISGNIMHSGDYEV